MKISLALGTADAEADDAAVVGGAVELDDAGVAAGGLTGWVVAEGGPADAGRVVVAEAEPADAVLGAAAGDDASDVADDAAGLVLAELHAATSSVVATSAARPSPDPAMIRMAFMIPHPEH